MRTAINKFIVHSLLFIVIFLPLLFFVFPTNTHASHIPGHWDLSATQSGADVIFSFNPPANGNFALLVTPPGGGAPVLDTGSIASPLTSYKWTSPAVGNYQATLVGLGLGLVGGPINVTVTAAGVPGVVGAGADPCEPISTFLSFGQVVDKVNRCKIQKTIYDDKATEANIVWGLSDAFYHLLTGNSQIYPEINEATAGMGALASSGTMVASLYNHPPISGMDYLASEFSKFNPVAPVYAQEAGGIGFNALRPVQDIWESFRNIAYIGFVLVFVIIGFMVMFRAHISPQAVATVQDSLPRIVIALFLVTFSYAIAGFMIDAMFLLLNVMINALPGDPENKQFVFKQSVFRAIWDSWDDVFGVVNNAIGSIITDVVDLGFLDKIIGGFGGILSALVVGIALLFVMFKVFIMLLMSYAYIVILTITAPFFFLAQALPGNNSGSTWFKQMAANIAVFPVVAIMFIFAGILGGVETLGGTAKAAIESGTVGNFPLLSGDIEPTAIGKLIAIGVLLMTPSAAELIKNAIGAKGPNAGAGIGASLAGGAAVVGAAGRGAINNGPIAGWRRARQAGEQERAQVRAGLHTYNEDWKEKHTDTRPT